MLLFCSYILLLLSALCKASVSPGSLNIEAVINGNFLKDFDVRAITMDTLHFKRAQSSVRLTFENNSDRTKGYLNFEIENAICGLFRRKIPKEEKDGDLVGSMPEGKSPLYLQDTFYKKIHSVSLEEGDLIVAVLAAPKETSFTFEDWCNVLSKDNNIKASLQEKYGSSTFVIVALRYSHSPPSTRNHSNRLTRIFPSLRLSMSTLARWNIGNLEKEIQPKFIHLSSPGKQSNRPHANIAIWMNNDAVITASNGGAIMVIRKSDLIASIFESPSFPKNTLQHVELSRGDIVVLVVPEENLRVEQFDNIYAHFALHDTESLQNVMATLMDDDLHGTSILATRICAEVIRSNSRIVRSIDTEYDSGKTNEANASSSKGSLSLFEMTESHHPTRHSSKRSLGS